MVPFLKINGVLSMFHSGKVSLYFQIKMKRTFFLSVKKITGTDKDHRKKESYICTKIQQNCQEMEVEKDEGTCK